MSSKRFDIEDYALFHSYCKSILHLRKIEAFINDGIDVNFIYKNRTPLLVAIKNNAFHVASLLILSDADVNLKVVDKIPIFKVIKMANLYLLEILAYSGDIRVGADINVRNYLGMTPLHMAVLSGHDNIFHLLLEKGADVNAQNIFGETPLHYAYSKQDEYKIFKLLAYGADSNIRNINGMTPAETKPFQVEKMKAALKIDKNIILIDLYTIFHYACATKNLELMREKIKIIPPIELREFINAKDKYGNTPLYYIFCNINFKRRSWDIVKFLLINGADINVENNAGLKPIDICPPKIRKYLLEWRPFKVNIV